MSKYPNKKSSWRKRILLTILILAVTAAGIYWYVATETFSDTRDRKAVYTVNASDFIREFRTDEKKAREKYRDKIIAVNGRVSELETADTTMNVKFVDSASGDYLIFAFQQQHLAEAKTLKVGDTFSIKAAFSDFLHSELLDVNTINFQRSTLNK